MHAVIYGTGKWATLIKFSLQRLGIETINVGSNTSFSTFTRDSLPKEQYQNLFVIIASATADHLTDLQHCLDLNPAAIFIEKGFSDALEKTNAKELCKSIPTFIMSQYRYSSVLENLKEFTDIRKIHYSWQIDKDDISEWVPHIISIDNFIKGTYNEYYTSEEGTHTIDDISSFTVKRSMLRLLRIHVECGHEDIYINLGKTNNILIKKKNLDIVGNLEYKEEDCLLKQLKHIIKDVDNLKLERL